MKKLHMFSVDIKNGPKLDEKLTVCPGDEMIVVKSPVGTLGLSTCYDVRFPELYSCLRQVFQFFYLPYVTGWC